MSLDLTPIARPKILVLGGGARANAYSGYILDHPDEAEIVGIAEPNPVRRQAFVDTYGVPADGVFETWEEALSQPKFADVAMVTTQDQNHVGPAIAATEKGYHILLEKPIAPTEPEVRAVVQAVQKAGVMLTVCHVMRYSPHTVELKKVIASGVIGDIVTIDLLEPVGFWHQAHSYVRGNWRNEALSSPMLLAKSCHDIDWLYGLIGERATRVTSFGSLTHFTPENQPAGASDRCLTCPSEIERACPYSAKKIYLEAFDGGKRDWPISTITDTMTREGVVKALENGPYGRCVYACDNDVVDHQVVNLEYENGVTAAFTMTAFSAMRSRRTRIFGTMGEISTDSQVITVTNFRTGEKTEIDISAIGHTAADGHGGGDAGIMKALLAALREGDPSLVPSNAETSLQSHLMVFAAERARHHGTVEEVPLS